MTFIWKCSWDQILLQKEIGSKRSMRDWVWSILQDTTANLLGVVKLGQLYRVEMNAQWVDVEKKKKSVPTMEKITNPLIEIKTANNEGDKPFIGQ